VVIRVDISRDQSRRRWPRPGTPSAGATGTNPVPPGRFTWVKVAS